MIAVVSIVFDCDSDESLKEHLDVLEDAGYNVEVEFFGEVEDLPDEENDDDEKESQES